MVLKICFMIEIEKQKETIRIKEANETKIIELEREFRQLFKDVKNEDLLARDRSK